MQSPAVSICCWLLKRNSHQTDAVIINRPMWLFRLIDCCCFIRLRPWGRSCFRIVRPCLRADAFPNGLRSTSSFRTADRWKFQAHVQCFSIKTLAIAYRILNIKRLVSTFAVWVSRNGRTLVFILFLRMHVCTACIEHSCSRRPYSLDCHGGAMGMYHCAPENITVFSQERPQDFG